MIVSQLLVGDEVIEKGGGARIWPWGDGGSPTCDHRPQAASAAAISVASSVRGKQVHETIKGNGCGTVAHLGLHILERLSPFDQLGEPKALDPWSPLVAYVGNRSDVIGTSSSHEFVAKVSPVDIRVEKGKVTLTGTTRGPIDNVEEVVRSVPGVTDVENRVVVVRYGAA